MIWTLMKSSISVMAEIHSFSHPDSVGTLNVSFRLIVLQDRSSLIALVSNYF